MHDDLNAILIDAKTACRLLSVSRRTLHTLVKRDGLPTVKLSSGSRGGVRFRLIDLERWAAQRVRRGARQQAEAAEHEGQGHGDAR